MPFFYKNNCVTFYKLSNGKGWIHNFITNHPSALNSIELVFNQVKIRLAINFPVFDEFPVCKKTLNVYKSDDVTTVLKKAVAKWNNYKGNSCIVNQEKFALAFTIHGKPLPKDNKIGLLFEQSTRTTNELFLIKIEEHGVNTSLLSSYK